MLCAGAALYFLIATVLGARGGATRRWILGCGVPAVLLGFFGGPLPAWTLATVLLAVAVWHVLYRRMEVPSVSVDGAPASGPGSPPRSASPPS